MSIFVGHKETVSKIPKPLPQTLLLVGPEGVGKSIVARLLATSTGVSTSDYQRVEKVTKGAAAEIVQHHSQHPLTSAVRVTVADLTSATPEGLNALLNILESPPPYSRFIFHSDRMPVLTIRSRCFVMNFGHLKDDEVAEVLKAKKIPEHILGDAARLSQGRVSVALEHARTYAARQHAQKILEALAGQDVTKIEQALVAALEKKAKEDDLRETIAVLLGRSMRASVSDPTHPLAFIPLEVRLSALSTFESGARAPLRVRSGVWSLVGSL